jgi:UDPglucose 6-dehydrogenase
VKVAVLGLWHLGTVTAACLASVGYTVVGFDDDPNLISRLQKGVLPVFEPELESLTNNGILSSLLQFSSDLPSICEFEVIWVAYDTPVDENDCADVEYVFKKVAAIYPHVRTGTLILVSSQLPVGSTHKLEENYLQVCPGKTVRFAYAPENLRLGRAIETFMKPERIVVGVRGSAEKDRVARLLRPLTENIQWMSVESAEMTKHALNGFLATSIVFINELATLCERVGADVRDVERGLRTDARIGPKAYLRAGPAFAGGTLARDVTSIVQLGQAEGLSVDLFTAVQRSNEGHKKWPSRTLVEVLGGLDGRSIGILGLTYKPGTSTLRRSSAVEIARWLHGQGASVLAYDPAISDLPSELKSFIKLKPSFKEAIGGTEAVYLATECAQFSEITADDLVNWMKAPIMIDPGRFLESKLGTDQRIRYFSIGRPK